MLFLLKTEALSLRIDSTTDRNAPQIYYLVVEPWTLEQSHKEQSHRGQLEAEGGI